MDRMEASSTLPGSRYLELPYRIILVRERRKGASNWLALVEELPGCEARGDTAEEATHAVREAMTAWFAAALEEGRAIPRPRSPRRSPNGRLALDIPRSLHEALTHAAVREGLTVDELVTIALAGVMRWRPDDEEPASRWIESRARSLMGADSGRPGLRRAIIFNVALLVLLAVAAIAILVVAITHGL
jgi:predicted RNase H-like HicB family nuclease